MAKNILFLCYWSLNDGLTKATVLPWLRVLQHNKSITRIRLVTIERQLPVNIDALPAELDKVIHQPLISQDLYINIVTKISDFVLFPRRLAQIAKQHKIDVVIAHGAPSGALACKVWRKKQLPFYVSLFEPHADYMAESGVWSRHGLKYKFQKKWEQQLLDAARGLMPVAENYRKMLLAAGVASSKIRTVPCSVDAAAFKFSAESRLHVRKSLQFSNAVVGIYVGKFGGLYYDKEAFGLFATCFRLINNFRLIILSPQEPAQLREKLKEAGIEQEQVFLTTVGHDEVPAYLAAADFAFAPYKYGQYKRFLSPVKIGEYWASGLPVLLTEGVGDDSAIIEHEGGGALFNPEKPGSVEWAINEIQKILQEPGHRQQIPELARKYRSPDKIKEAYEYFFGNQEESP